MHRTHTPQIYCSSRDGIDPITHAQVKCDIIDYSSTMWSYENCKMTFDHPFTVKTLALGQLTFMYSYLKLTPGMYICTVKSSGTPNCRLELIQREKDGDDDDANNWQNRILHRHGCLCTNTTDLKLLNTGDTDVELRIIFDPYSDVRIPSFACMEVRSRQRIAMPMKSKIQSGLYKPRPLRYGSLDVHKILKKIHYVIHWLETLDENIDEILKMVSNPLFDIDDNNNAFDYTHYMQDIQNAISIELPHTFVANSYCFSVYLFPGVKIPLMSQSLIRELSLCISNQKIKTDKLVHTLRHSSKYINFMLVEYIEFKQCVSDKLKEFKSEKEYEWQTIQITI
jgi:hypothetical protein